MGMASYQPVTKEIVEQLEKIAPGRVYFGDDVNPDYGRDEMPIYGTRVPEASVDALTTEEIAAVMKLCYENNIPVTTRGAGTGLVGGCVPVMGGVVIATTKMNKILGYDLDNYTVTVQPGVLLQQLAEDALSHECLYPPDPGEKLATLGGNVSTNASGMRGVKYGATRDYVKAMTVVLPTGEITHFGSSVSKTSSGYNLLHLMIGSEGTLGIITELTLKLIPAPKAAVSLVVPFEDLASCIAMVPKLRHSGLNPQAIEFFEKAILVTSETYLKKQVFPRVVDGVDVGAYLLITFDGESDEALNPIIERAAELLLDQGALDVLVADSAPKRKEAWAARSSANTFTPPHSRTSFQMAASSRGTPSRMARYSATSPVPRGVYRSSTPKGWPSPWRTCTTGAAPRRFFRSHHFKVCSSFLSLRLSGPRPPQKLITPTS